RIMRRHVAGRGFDRLLTGIGLGDRAVSPGDLALRIVGRATGRYREDAALSLRHRVPRIAAVTATSATRPHVFFFCRIHSAPRRPSWVLTSPACLRSSNAT